MDQETINKIILSNPKVLYLKRLNESVTPTVDSIITCYTCVDHTLSYNEEKHYFTIQCLIKTGRKSYKKYKIFLYEKDYNKTWSFEENVLKQKKIYRCVIDNFTHISYPLYLPTDKELYNDAADRFKNHIVWHVTMYRQIRAALKWCKNNDHILHIYYNKNRITYEHAAELMGGIDGNCCK